MSGSPILSEAGEHWAAGELAKYASLVSDRFPEAYENIMAAWSCEQCKEQVIKAHELAIPKPATWLRKWSDRAILGIPCGHRRGPGAAHGHSQSGASHHAGSHHSGTHLSHHSGSHHPGSHHPGSHHPGSHHPGSHHPGSYPGSLHSGSHHSGSHHPGSHHSGSHHSGSHHPGSHHSGSHHPGSHHPGSHHPGSYQGGSHRSGSSSSAFSHGSHHHGGGSFVDGRSGMGSGSRHGPRGYEDEPDRTRMSSIREYDEY